MPLVVKDEGINQARTPEQALQHISGMRPFIELPDLALAPSEKLDGTQLAAINVAARLGVAGEEVPLQATPDSLSRNSRQALWMAGPEAELKGFRARKWVETP